MIASEFGDDRMDLTEDDMELMTTFDEVIEYLQNLAEDIPYLDEYKILVTEACTEPFIVMPPDEFLALHKKVVGE